MAADAAAPGVRDEKDQLPRRLGEPQQVNAPIDRPPVIFPDTAYPLSSLLAVKPGEVAGLTVMWTNWCDPQIAGKKRVPRPATGNTAVRILAIQCTS